MKIKDDDEKEYIWWTKSRHALYSLFSTGSKWKFLILLFIFVILVIIIIAGFSLSLVAPYRVGNKSCRKYPLQTEYRAYIGFICTTWSEI